MSDAYRGIDYAHLAMIEKHLVQLVQDLLKEDAPKQEIETRIRAYVAIKRQLEGLK